VPHRPGRRRRRAINTTVSEPVPGHTLIETGSGIETTFTIEPTSGGARVRFETLIDDGGVQGILTVCSPRGSWARSTEDELRLLADYAKAHPPLS
jgi:hypothetical protein